MVQRGFVAELLPRSSRIAEVSVAAVTETDPSICAACVCSGASIDKYDSRDLDQLSVAEVLLGSITTILVAVSDVDAIVKRRSAIDGSCSSQHHLRVHGCRRLPHAPRETLHQSHFPQRGPAAPGIVIELALDADGVCRVRHLSRVVRNRPSLLTTRRRLARRLGPRTRRRLAVVPGLHAHLRSRPRSSGATSLRHQHGALNLQTLATRPVFTATFSDCQPDEPNRAKQLIDDFMIAAERLTRQLSRSERVSLRYARLLRSPDRRDRIIVLLAPWRRLAPRPQRALALRVPHQRRKPDPNALSRSLPLCHQAPRSGEYVLEFPANPSTDTSGSPSAITRIPPLPIDAFRISHAALAQGRSRRRDATVQHRRVQRPSPAIVPNRKPRDQGGATSEHPSLCYSWHLASASYSMPSLLAPPRRVPGSVSLSHRGRQAPARFPWSRCRRPRPCPARQHQCRARFFIDFARLMGA